MARGRSGRGFQRKAKDWVINQYTYNFLDVITLAPGPLGGVFLPLTFSDQTRSLDLGGDEFVHSWASIPEGMGPRTYAVKGHILVEPLPWTAGSAFTLACRIVVLGMDPDTLGALVPGLYTLLDSAAYVYADEPFAWQEVVSEQAGPAGANRTRFTLPVNATVNRRLANNEALYLVMEVGAGGVDVQVQPLLRTLMAIE